MGPFTKNQPSENKSALMKLLASQRIINFFFFFLNILLNKRSASVATFAPERGKVRVLLFLFFILSSMLYCKNFTFSAVKGQHLKKHICCQRLVGLVSLFHRQQKTSIFICHAEFYSNTW